MEYLTRRTVLSSAAKASFAAPFVLRGRFRVFAQSAREYPERVVRLMRESLVIDMLNQFLYREDQRDLLAKWLTQPGAFTGQDFLKFRSSGVSVINFGYAAVDLPDAQQKFLKWNDFIGRYPQWLMRIDTAADLSKAKQQGRFGVVYGLQSSAQFETLEAVDRCYLDGQRVSQLCYNFRTLVADGAFEPFDAGVSEYGGKVIERMNKAGMALDLAHASDKTKLDALALSNVPVILSHGNCRALNPAALRCTTDEAIRKLAAKGGVMGITAQRCLIKGSDKVGIDDLVDHYDHVRDLVGIEHVGVGSDAGIESHDLAPPSVLRNFQSRVDRRYNLHGDAEMVPGMEGPARMYELTAALVRRGYTDEQVRLVIGGNWARVLGEIWRA